MFKHKLETLEQKSKRKKDLLIIGAIMLIIMILMINIGLFVMDANKHKKNIKGISIQAKVDSEPVEIYVVDGKEITCPLGFKFSLERSLCEKKK